jgi:hypothetical protein
VVAARGRVAGRFVAGTQLAAEMPILVFEFRVGEDLPT